MTKIKYGLLLIGLFLSGCSTYHPSQSQLHAQYAPVTKGQIEYYRFGQGTPILLIPGYATDVSSWNRDFLAALAERHELIILNNRNVGGSLVNSSRYDSRDLANDVSQLIQDLHLKKPAVLGISMGGMIAQQVAVLHPDDMSQLILINTAIAGHQGVHPAPAVKKALLSMPENKFGFYAVAVNSFFPPTWKARMAYSLAADRFLPGDYHEINRSDIMPEQKDLVLSWSNDDATAKKISQLSMPTLILNGEADMVIPPINSRILLHSIPHAKLVRWKQGGHAMIYQFPREIAHAVDAFIAETS